MKKFYLVIVVALFCYQATAVPLTGTKTIRTAGGDYPTFTAAFADLNANGVGAGGVIFNVDAGFTSAEDPVAITATGTANNPVIFQKSGTGANPAVKPTGTAATNEFAIKIAGGDYFTFDGIDVTINTGSLVEWGYVLEGSSANGCRNNTVRNCNITLNKTNTASRGVYVYSATAPTSALNSNSNNKFYNVNIQNTYAGYFLSGSSTYLDQNNEIGTINGGTATLSNIGGGTVTCSVISVTSQQNLKLFSQNIINDSTTTAQINGILQSGAASTSSIYNNVIRNVKSNTTSTSTVYGINISGGTSIKIYNNIIDSVFATNGAAAGINGSTSGSGSTYPVYDVYANKITNIRSNGTSAINSAFGFNNSGANVTLNLYKNYVSNIENNGGGTAGLAVGISTSGGSGATNTIPCNVYNNFVSGIKNPAGTAVGGTRGINLVGGTSYFYVFNNTVYLDYTPTAATASGAALFLAASSNSFDIRNNIFVNNMVNGSGARSVALYAAGTGYLSKFASTSDNNVYFAGTPSATNLIYYDGTNADLRWQ